MEMVGATFTTCPFLGTLWIVNLLKMQTQLSHRCSCCFAFWHILSSATMWSVSTGICWPNNAPFKLFDRPLNGWGLARNELQINFSWTSSPTPKFPKSHHPAWNLLNPSEASLSSVRLRCECDPFWMPQVDLYPCSHFSLTVFPAGSQAVHQFMPHCHWLVSVHFLRLKPVLFPSCMLAYSCRREPSGEPNQGLDIFGDHWNLAPFQLLSLL